MYVCFCVGMCACECASSIPVLTLRPYIIHCTMNLGGGRGREKEEGREGEWKGVFCFQEFYPSLV